MTATPKGSQNVTGTMKKLLKIFTVAGSIYQAINFVIAFVNDLLTRWSVWALPIITGIVIGILFAVMYLIVGKVKGFMKNQLIFALLFVGLLALLILNTNTFAGALNISWSLEGGLLFENATAEAISQFWIYLSIAMICWFCSFIIIGIKYKMYILAQ